LDSDDFLEHLDLEDIIDDEAIKVDDEELTREEAAANETESSSDSCSESDSDSGPEEESIVSHGAPTATDVDDLSSFLEQQESGDPATLFAFVSPLSHSSHFLNSVPTGVRRGGRASKFPISPKRLVVLINLYLYTFLEQSQPNQ
jgi:hypothetical protein